MRNIFARLFKRRAASAPPAAPTGPIRRLEALRRGQSWQSDNGRVVLRLDQIGELVLLLDGRAVWRPPVTAKADRLLIQNDGLLSLWMGHDCLWSVGKPNRRDAELRLQDDGNIVLYDANVALWWSGTHL